MDVGTDTVKSIPFCIWEKYKTVVMKDIAEKYNKEGYNQGLSRAKLKEREEEKDKESVPLSRPCD